VPLERFVRFPLLLGPPGASKTHILLTVCAYALSKGLKTMIVAITSERARILGGEHVHWLFAIPVIKSTLETPVMSAEKSLAALARQPVRMAFLKRLDVMIFEEIGLLSVELYVTMDLVLRRLRDSNAPFGGVLLIASGDPRQLPPVEGTAIWRSSQLVTNFLIMNLRHYVRSRRDADLQRILSLMRQPILSDEEIEEVLTVIRRQVFVPSWDAVPADVLRVVGKKTAEREAVTQFLRAKTNDPTIEHGLYSAEDTVETLAGNWGPADGRVSAQLDYHTTVDRELTLFVGAVMRITFNNPVARREFPRFSQGQLVVVVGLPDPHEQHRNDQRVRARLIPAGERILHVRDIPEHWEPITFRRRVTNTIVVGAGATKARREQWPLRHYVCSTIHKVIGETIPFLATQISHSSPKYRLWQREQLLTVLSRVEELSGITFVGSKEDTLAAVASLLRADDASVALVERLLDQLDVLHDSPRVLDPDVRFLEPLSVDVPSLDSGFVYLAVCARDPALNCHGNCASIRAEMADINGSLASLVAPHIRCGFPWVVLAFVTGFSGQGADECNLVERRDFVHEWLLGSWPDEPITTKEKLQALKDAHAWALQVGRFSGLVFKQCCTLPDEEQSDSESDTALQDSNSRNLPEGTRMHVPPPAPCSPPQHHGALSSPSLTTPLFDCETVTNSNTPDMRHDSTTDGNTGVVGSISELFSSDADVEHQQLAGGATTPAAPPEPSADPCSQSSLRTVTLRWSEFMSIYEDLDTSRPHVAPRPVTATVTRSPLVVIPSPCSRKRA
jgi:hypothetical protein